ncbi:MAG: DUF642 domain-containing protein, partial [Candidatus Competibacterales bacterium]|nr:DUF642 domain-containing protein [Candidatus Competibacterales bacterium]
SILLLVPVGRALAMADPEDIQWIADRETFIVSLFQGTFGRTPSPGEQAWARERLSRGGSNLPLRRYNLLVSLLGSDEYRYGPWGELPRPYNVYFKTRWLDSDSGRRLCHCYYFAEFSDGHMPSMQYSGIPAPAGRVSYPEALSLVLAYNLFDREACPHYDCGYSDSNRTRQGQGADTGSANLVRDPSFSGFGNPSGAWGTGVQYGQYGIWWNSRNARSTARTVDIASDVYRTALYINNQSVRSPHVFGTTAQRISVTPGRTYRVSLWARARNLRSNGAINIVVDPEWKVRPINLTGGTYDWQQFSGTFQAARDYVDLRIISEDIGEAWLTGMRLEAVD